MDSIYMKSAIAEAEKAYAEGETPVGAVIVKDGEIIIVDEFTGRLMFGRRYSEGLHQAIEAKEHVDVQRENKTLATITFQNYFRLYGKLSGMTGTALTEEEEFTTIYELDIVEIPTNKPVIRKDWPDVVYKNEAGKDRAIIRQIIECHAKGQPVLVGTISIEKSEYLSSLLKKQGIPHNVLNAKQHEREAEIVAQAGKLGAVTIATNMAGRGTDIMLGGNAEYLAKTDLKKAGFEEEVIAEATGYAETDDEEILRAREMYAQRLAEHKKVTDAEAELVRAAGETYGPMFLRFTRDAVPVIYDEDAEFTIGKANKLREGKDVAIIAVGDTVRLAIDAAKVLYEQGIEARVLDMHTIKPLDTEAVNACIADIGKIVTVEDHNILNALGSAVCECVAEAGQGIVRRIGVQDQFGESAPYERLLAKNGITVENIIAQAKSIL